MGLLKEAEPQQNSGALKNIQLPVMAEGDRQFSPIAYRLPSIGLFLWATAGITEDADWDHTSSMRANLDPKYRGWNIVRKGPQGLSGFRGYFEGLNWSTEEIEVYLEKLGHDMLESITRSHRFTPLRNNCIDALSGNRPFSRESMTELHDVFGATLGRMRALIFDDKNIHSFSGDHAAAIHKARRDNDIFRLKTQATAFALPVSTYSYNTKEPLQFSMQYYLPKECMETASKPSKTESQLIIEKIGIVGIPAIRAGLSLL